MLESAIQKKILDYLKTLDNCWCCKIITANKNGTPDILGVLEGRLFGLEVKTPTGRVSKLQEYQLEQIQKAGGIGAVVRSVEDVRKCLQLTDLNL